VILDLHGILPFPGILAFLGLNSPRPGEGTPTLEPRHASSRTEPAWIRSPETNGMRHRLLFHSFFSFFRPPISSSCHYGPAAFPWLTLLLYRSCTFVPSVPSALPAPIPTPFDGGSSPFLPRLEGDCTPFSLPFGGRRIDFFCFEDG